MEKWHTLLSLDGDKLKLHGLPGKGRDVGVRQMRIVSVHQAYRRVVDPEFEGVSIVLK
jgi:hypothetical protein